MIEHLILLKIKNDGCQRGLVSMICKLFYKKTSATRANAFVDSGIKNKKMLKKNQLKNYKSQLLEKLNQEK